MFLLIVIWVASAVLCAIVAKEKGYVPVAWFFGGLFFGFFALMAAAGLPDLKLRKYIKEIAEKWNAYYSYYSHY